MASNVHLDRKLIAHGNDISEQMIAAQFTRGRRSKAADTWGQSTRRTGAGIVYAELSGSGFTRFGAGLQDAAMESLFGVSGRNYSLLTRDGSAGNYAWTVRGLQNEYNPFDTGQAEEFAGFAFGIVGSDHFGGIVSVNQAVTATLNGTAIQQAGGLVAANKQGAFICAHVTETSGGSPTFDVTLESATDDVFTSPTTRATLSQITAAGVSEFAKFVPSADVADEYWRAVVTYGGTGQGNVVVCIGIEGPTKS